MNLAIALAVATACLVSPFFFWRSIYGKEIRIGWRAGILTLAAFFGAFALIMQGAGPSATPSAVALTTAGILCFDAFMLGIFTWATYFAVRASQPARRIPQDVVIAQFGCIMAANPEIIDSMIKGLARQYGTRVADTHRYVFGILRRMEPSFD